jgi:lipopolysaccharide export system permease protein
MPRRLPITLWLYVLGDLWKLVLLTTAVLVTVIAFAAAVKPLADGKLGPEDTLKFMLLAMVPMLQYALPFAACFGATLAYHRLATDNELTAVHAGGVSHKMMLVPAAVSGLVLAGLLLTLSNSVIPRFLRGMSELVAQDAAKIIVNSVQRGEALRMDNTLIYADKVERLGPDELSGAYERLWLGGLLVVRTNDKGEIDSQGSANSAAVWLRRTNVVNGPRGQVASADGKPATEVVIKPTNPVGLGAAVRASSADAVMSFVIPNAFGDNVKFLSFSELRQLRKEPAGIDRVNKSKRTVAQILSECDVMARINDALRTTGVARFSDPFKQPVVLHGSGLRPTKREGKRDASVYQILPLTGGSRMIEVDTQQGNGKPLRNKVKDGYVRLPGLGNTDRGAATVTLQLERVTAAQAGPDGEVDAPEDTDAARGELEQRPLADLTFADDQTATFLAKSTRETEELAEKRMADKPGDQPVLSPALATLRSDVLELLNEVLSKEQERYAMSVACLVMVLVGAVMAMRLRDALPLTVYLWAFFPALATVLAISGGQQLTHGKGMVGLPVLWAGVGALSAFAVVEFLRLRKH